MMVLSLFSGASLSTILMMILFLILLSTDKEQINKGYFINEYFQLDPIFRLLFTSAYIAFAAGLLVKVWQKHEINYIHLMEVKQEHRMNPYQLWRITAILFFIAISGYFVSIFQFAQIYEKYPNKKFVKGGNENPLTEYGLI